MTTRKLCLYTHMSTQCLSQHTKNPCTLKQIICTHTGKSNLGVHKEVGHKIPFQLRSYWYFVGAGRGEPVFLKNVAP